MQRIPPKYHHLPPIVSTSLSNKTPHLLTFSLSLTRSPKTKGKKRRVRIVDYTCRRSRRMIEHINRKLHLHLLIVVGRERSNHASRTLTINPGRRNLLRNTKLGELGPAMSLGSMKQVIASSLHTCNLLSIHWPSGVGYASSELNHDEVFVVRGTGGCVTLGWT